jgi:type VI secretion system secreted protein VgrG
MPVFTQTHRQIAVTTPLGDDRLLLAHVHGAESLSRPFQYELDLLSEDPDIDAEELIGQNVTVRLALPGEATRYFNGYISQFAQTYREGRLYRYSATLVPWLWFLSRRANCRIFQHLTVPAIAQQLFSEHGFADVRLELSGAYRTWEYCVQYRETDLNFVSRLLEHEGIYYYFGHDNGKHTLVLADDIHAHAPVPGYEEISYLGPERAAKKEFIRDWQVQYSVEPAKFLLNDFDFTAPRKTLLAAARNGAGVAPQTAPHGIYDYPGGYRNLGEGESYATVRMQEQQCRYAVASGHSDARGLTTGSTFVLTDHPRESSNRRYLVISTSCELRAENYPGVAEASESVFSCAFLAIDAEQRFRPARVSPQPVVQGPQTALVVGPAGQEIYTDAYGRVKVQFHWDRYGQNDQNSSCWVRVSQAWAGQQWGAIFTPRIGQEVIVEFLEGNPDRPLITGRVYNGDNMPPYALPERATQSGFLTHSTPGGGGFNELRFEDKKGQEHIFVQAQRDMHIRVKHSRYELQENQRHLTVQNDKLVHVKGASNEIIDGDRKEKVGGAYFRKVSGDNALGIGGALSVTVAGDVAESFAQSHWESVGHSYYLVASDLVIEAETSLTLKCGGNSIVIDGDGVTINGEVVTIDSTQTKINSGPGSSAEDGEPTALVEVKSPQEAKLPMASDDDSPSGVEEVASPAPGAPPAVTPEPFLHRLKKKLRENTLGKIGELGGAAAGAAIGTAIFPGAGTLGGAVVGAILGVVGQSAGEAADPHADSD